MLGPLRLTQCQDGLVAALGPEAVATVTSFRLQVLVAPQKLVAHQPQTPAEFGNG